MFFSTVILAAPIAILTSVSCSGGGMQAASGAAARDSTARAGVTAATPVQMALVTRATLSITVTGPGRTDAIDEQRVRAPYQGKLVSLTVVPGDRVHAGQQIGAIVSQTSEATLLGARALAAEAQSAAEQADARRAVDLATRGLVRTPLRVPRAGVVISRSASPGDLLNTGDSVVSVAATGSIVFIAQIAQNDIASVRPGQPVLIELGGGTSRTNGIVSAILPADTSNGMSLRVRITIPPGQLPVTLGLFGTADITVGQHAGVIAIPSAAVIRDDISGSTRVATVGADNHAHWVAVTTGITDRGLVEIVSPLLPPGTRVITAGQVGLADSARVTPDTTATALGGSSGVSAARSPSRSPARSPTSPTAARVP